MLIYLFPIDVLSFYYGKIHRYLEQQGHHWKGLACVSIYCICRLLYKLLQARHNSQKKMARKLQFQNKYEKFLQALDALEHPLDMSIIDLPFDDLREAMKKKSKNIADVLLAFRIRGVSTDVRTNAIVTLLHTGNTDGAGVTASSDVTDVASGTKSLDVTDAANDDQMGPAAQEEQTREKPKSSGVSVFKSCFRGLWKCHQPEHDKDEPGVAAPTRRKIIQIDSQHSLLNNVPISLAEVIHLQSMDATAGLSSYLEVKAEEDAVVVQVLKAHGAIPVMRTNVPQTAYLTFGSSNPIFGVTKNPYKSDRSPGGASSGEGVIASTRSSVLGVGVDLAGGLRIPAHFCGVCGFKPTSERVSRAGVTEPVQGQDAVVNCVGPISSEVAGLVAFMKCVCMPLQHELDPTVSMTPFNNEMYESTEPLCVGFFIDDGHTKCVPSVRRVLMEAKALLENIGYKVVPFEPPDLLNMLTRLYMPALLGDHYFKLLRTLSVDQVDGCVSRTYYLLHLPFAVRWLWSWWFYRQNPVNSSLLAVKCPISVAYWWKLINDVTAWKRKFISLMDVQDIDVLLCPVLPCAAVKLGDEAKFTGCLTYSVLFNLLDFPAGTVPMSTVTAGDIADLQKPEIYKVETSLERRIQKDQLGYENQPGSSSQNLPIGVQIASLPYQDEMVLRVLRDLEKKTRGNVKRPSADYGQDMMLRI